MRYAVIDIGGKQFKVSKGDIIEVEKFKPFSKEAIFDRVLLIASNDSTPEFKLGKPYLKDTFVKGEIIEEKKGPKVKVVKFKAKVRYRKKLGFRQDKLRVLIKNIES